MVILAPWFIAVCLAFDVYNRLVGLFGPLVRERWHLAALILHCFWHFHIDSLNNSLGCCCRHSPRGRIKEFEAHIDHLFSVRQTEQSSVLLEEWIGTRTLIIKHHPLHQVILFIAYRTVTRLHIKKKWFAIGKWVCIALPLVVDDSLE